jgi:hypothetical protein
MVRVRRESRPGRNRRWRWQISDRIGFSHRAACHLNRSHDLVGRRRMLGLVAGCAKPLPVIRDDHKPLAPALREGALARGLLRRVTAPGTGPNRTESLTYRLDSDSGLSVLFDIVAENRTQ